MLSMFKTLATAVAVVFVCQDAMAQYDMPPRPPLPPGMTYDTIRRKDADNWEFVQVKMPGKMVDRNSNEGVIAEGSFHNGLLDGTWMDYWDNQTLHQITYYSKGKKNGVSVSFDPVGSLMKTESYSNDMLEGPTRLYAPHTGLIIEETYYSQGKKHGRHIKWYPSRTIQEEGNYVNGVLDGTATWYYDDGKKSVVYTYHNGALNGTATVYYKNDMVSDMGEYVNDMQSGHWKEFHENGNLKEEGEYVKGQKEGIWKQYDIQGQFITTVKYKKGELQKK